MPFHSPLMPALKLDSWQRTLSPLVLVALLAAPMAPGYAAAPQLKVSDADIARAGIAVSAARASLDASAAASNGTRFTGTVVAQSTSLVLVSSALAGVVQKVHVASLQEVRAGAPLVTMFSQPYLALQGDYVLTATQARLAADKLTRDDSLFKDGIIARARLDESRAAAQLAAVAAAERAQALQRAGLGAAQLTAIAHGGTRSPLLVIRAPATGGILELPVTAGQQIEAGAAIARLARAAPLWVELQASRQQSPLKIGDRLQVSGCSLLRVIAISPVVNSSTQSLQVRAQQLDRDPCLKINAYVEASLLEPERQAGSVAVPEVALVRRGTEQFVFVRQPGGFRIVAVQARAAGGGMLWVHGAIGAGDAVATKGLVALKGAWAGLGNASVAEPVPAGAR